MLETVYGHTKKQAIAAQLKQVLDGMHLNGTFYIGYPVLASADEKIEVDGLLLTQEHGLIAFLLADNPPSSEAGQTWVSLQDDQDRLFFALETNLSRHESLRAGRRLGVDVGTLTVFPVRPDVPETLAGRYASLDDLPRIISTYVPVEERFFRPLQAALQRVTTIKPHKKRTNVTKAASKGAILKKIEKEIANLDQWQKRAAIETPEGPQRIRGLAGSGKTVVLALKAAYLHAQHPDWNIAVTFHTRSLYQQLKDLVRRFSFEHLNDEPNWERLRIMHAWGSSDRGGVYTEIAQHADAPVRDFLYGKTTFGISDAFKGVCAELLAATSSRQIEPLYQAVLVDEAQDLPPEFFQVIFRFTEPPKRIVWAYDELQKLSESVMPGTEDLFGRDSEGRPKVELANIEGRPRQDLILPVCYRNTPWALTLAHALGFGIYRKGGLVQHFDDPALWTEIGYKVVDGSLDPGAQVSLERNPSTYPDYFNELLNPADAIRCETFANELEQSEWVAERIGENLQEDELQADDILIILPNAYTAKNEARLFMQALDRGGIESHLAGVTTSRDEIFTKNSIAIANIYRSKGNEAPIVYVVNSQHCYSGYELITLRNILFTAITRCRAWVRICGWGLEMRDLMEEIRAVQQNTYRLRFSVPTAGQLKKLRMIHRDRTADEKARLKRFEAGLKDFVKAVETGELALESLPAELRGALRGMLKRPARGEDDFE